MGREAGAHSHSPAAADASLRPGPNPWSSATRWGGHLSHSAGGDVRSTGCLMRRCWWRRRILMKWGWMEAWTGDDGGGEAPREEAFPASPPGLRPFPLGGWARAPGQHDLPRRWRGGWGRRTGAVGTPPGGGHAQWCGPGCAAAAACTHPWLQHCQVWAAGDGWGQVRWHVP